MRHEFLVLTVKTWFKSVYIYRSYHKIKTGLSLFLTTLYIILTLCLIVTLSVTKLSQSLWPILFILRFDGLKQTESVQCRIAAA